ncbi:hypothetical protein EUGRSUZ_I01945 [Eucalyptus grandis]|uniref:Uncharacterized protein n=2 Tax=Eucalyptus grandis TaxID=71139 RepID=A0ACC3JGL5_EUCGR|nr:hypothetical protein EUGRSUZ_I01945 [Eucalyptus grandis]
MRLCHSRTLRPFKCLNAIPSHYNIFANNPVAENFNCQKRCNNITSFHSSWPLQRIGLASLLYICDVAFAPQR